MLEPVVLTVTALAKMHQSEPRQDKALVGADGTNLSGRGGLSLGGVNLRVPTPDFSFQNNLILTHHIHPDLFGDLVFRDRFDSLP